MAQRGTRRTVAASPAPTEHIDRVDSLPPNQSRNGPANPRHSKRLSLNFPVLVPPRPQIQSDGSRIDTGSPAILTPLDSPQLGAVSSSSAASVTAPNPSQATVESADFLTLLAAQERRVLELREELQRAETDLRSLKKQWAMHEATKKRSEGAKGQSLQMHTLSGGDGVTEAEKTKTSVERRRTLVERNGGGGAKHVPRKSQQRIFSGSRHARTLSLLTTPSAGAASKLLIRNSLDETASPERDVPIVDGVPAMLSRTSTLPELSEQLGFGKTYRDLANRRSLAQVPPSAEVFVRQGRQMAEGIREGLWTFFEDIRQATVGEEGVSGNGSAGARPQRQGNTPSGVMQKSKKAGDKQKRAGAVKPSGGEGAPGAEKGAGREKERSFWNEFGLDTPQRRPAASNAQSHLAKPEQSIADPTNSPPALGPDHGVDLEDDAWEVWESPSIASPSIGAPADLPTTTTTTSTPKPGQALPWPELKRLTPSKLTRTVSQLMSEWADQQPPAAGREMVGQVEGTAAPSSSSSAEVSDVGHNGLGIQRVHGQHEHDDHDGHALASTLM